MSTNADCPTEADPPKATHIYVHLGPKEWGNELMRQIAEEIAREHGDKPHLLITVYEHGGWFLRWFVDAPGELVMVGTANDMAKFNERSTRVREFLARHDLTWNHLPSIRRP